MCTYRRAGSAHELRKPRCDQVQRPHSSHTFRGRDVNLKYGVLVEYALRLNASAHGAYSGQRLLVRSLPFRQSGACCNQNLYTNIFTYMQSLACQSEPAYSTCDCVA